MQDAVTLGSEKTHAATMPKFCPACRERFPPDALFCPNDGTPLLTAPKFDPAPGEAGPDPYIDREISGHIEVKQLAGVGAMGRVYRAFQKGIDRDVAVKILHRELSANPQLVSRFHREAKVASRLQHPNVVHVHLAGQLPDGALYIVMEFLDGMSLQSALNAVGGSMPLPRALHVALQLCDAVGEAHVQGIVHRDLKPENVMLVKRGQDTDYVKVLDFGIARLSWGEQSMATAAGLIFGTARYISPEGAQGEAVGPPGDVYAIATLLFQMLAGRTPFEGDQAVGLLIQQIHDAPPQLQSIPRAAYVPGPVAAVIMQNLAKSPHARAPDARALARSILEAARMSGLSADDFAPPSLRLSGPAPAGQMKLAPMQQTKQLQLTPEMVERLSPTPPPQNAGVEAETETNERANLRPGAALTAKWTPSPEFQERLSPRPAPTYAASAAGVDETMDDDDGPPPPNAPPSFPSAPQSLRSHPSIPATDPTPPPAPFSEPSLPPHQTSQPSFPAPTRTEVGTTPPILAPSYPPIREPSERPANPAGYGVAPPTPIPPRDARDQETGPRGLNVPTPPQPFEAGGGEDQSPARWLRYTAIFILLFFAGSAVAGLVLYKMGLIEAPSLSKASIDDQVQHANDALAHERWDAPPGDNVKDITDAALVRFPHDPRLVDIRSRASDELVKRAVGLRMANDVAGAVHLARLATELDPTDETTRSLAKEYEADLAAKDAGDSSTLADASLPPINSSRPNTAPWFGARATLDAVPAKPKLGQSVELTAKTFGASGGAPKKVEDAAFTLSGPGIGAGTKLSAMGEGSIFRGGFSFLEAGKYDVLFSAKVDGVLVRSSRTVVVEPPGGANNNNNNNPTPTPPPSGSVKWL